jgi:hypothetical protein
LAEAAIDAQPAMAEVTMLMMDFIRATFESQGRRGGGSWAQLTDEWLTRKIKLGGDPRIGFFRHHLFEAFTVPGAEHQEIHIEPHSASIMSDLPYAATQQAHRPFIKFTPNDRIRMGEVVTQYLVEAWMRDP